MAIAKTAIIHPTAIIDDGAIIHDNVQIGPYCLIGKEVEIGENTVLKSHVIVNGVTKIGRNNEIYQFASIGEANQDLKYKGEPTRVEIGDFNRIRESCTIHRGTIQEEGITRIGNHNLFMVNSHIAHDCKIGNHCIIANNVPIAGHVTIKDFAIIGGNSAVHQFCVVGEHVMIGGVSGVVQDVPPYVLAQGTHASPYGINIEGLKRRGFSKESIHLIRQVYKMIYRGGTPLEQIIKEIEEIAKEHEEIVPFVTFFKQSTRGIIR